MLTDAQKTTLKAYILADAVLGPISSGPATDYNSIMLALNADSTFIVWKTSVSPSEWRKAIVAAAVQLDNLTVGKRDALLYVVQDALDATVASTRTTIDDLCGTQNTLKASLLAAQKRKATVAEKVLSTGTGTDATPGLTTFEGQVSVYDVAEILTT